MINTINNTIAWRSTQDRLSQGGETCSKKWRQHCNEQCEHIPMSNLTANLLQLLGWPATIFLKACSNEANMLDVTCWPPVWTPCWMILDNVGLSLSLVKIFIQHRVTLLAQQCWRMLAWITQALKHCVTCYIQQFWRMLDQHVAFDSIHMYRIWEDRNFESWKFTPWKSCGLHQNWQKW